jgi:hypothetical protein
MRYPESGDRPLVGTVGAVAASLGAAAVFEVMTVLETQDQAVRAVSPWRDDPYNTAVSLAVFTVPALAVLIGLRLLAWRWPGGFDRGRQVVRAAAVMTALAGLTAACEWAAVAERAHRSSWSGRTGLLIAGLAAQTLLLAVAAGLLARRRQPRGAPVGWRHDWLADVTGACALIPVVRRWPARRAAAWVRAHAMGVFTAASLLAAAGVIGALAVGERWTSPLLIGWAVTAETAAFLAFCVISNAVACFIALPPRPPARRAAEAAVVLGGVAVQLAIAFHDPLWQLVRGRPLASASDLAVLTLVPGAAAALAAAAFLLWRLRRPPGAPGPPSAAPLPGHLLGVPRPRPEKGA